MKFVFSPHVIHRGGNQYSCSSNATMRVDTANAISHVDQRNIMGPTAQCHERFIQIDVLGA